ncbi:PadR family transcriptional regulator [Streptomyces sp. NBC_00344]|uniref:PadR family transcriptional regulator n=1 Tax=Streptomyces sp. NBC_00344 TaxID=2975720 RepID=UPI002E1F5DD7
MSLRHALLGLLVDRRASGYDLMKLFDGSLANVWSANQSQVYGELKRLADTGLVTVASEGPRGRKEYALTDEGLAELHSWLVDTESGQATRSDVLLRVFFLGVLSHDEAVAFLRHRAQLAADEHTKLEAIKESIASDDSPLAVEGALALEFGLRFSAMREEWANWAVGQLRDTGGPAAS